MWTAHLFQTINGNIGPRLNFSSLSWDIDLNDVESISVGLKKSDLPKVDLRYWLSPSWAGVVVMWKGTPIVAGPILARPTESNEEISLSCGGIRSILAKRLVSIEQTDWSKQATSVIHWKGMSLGTIAKRAVEQAQAKYAGDLPITYAVPDQMISVRSPVKYGSVSQQDWDLLLSQGWWGDPTDKEEKLYPPELRDPNANHERTYRGFNVQNIDCDAILTKLSNVIDGPDIMFKPRLVRDNYLTFDLWTGTEASPRIYQKHIPVWDTTSTKGHIQDIRIVTSGAYQTNRVYSVGAGQDEGTLIKVNTNTAPLRQGYPLLETTISTSSSEDPKVVNAHGVANLWTNKEPLVEIQMTVRGDGVIPVGEFWPGDLVEVVVKGWLSLPDGKIPMRLLSMSGGDGMDIKVSLQAESRFADSELNASAAE